MEKLFGIPIDTLMLVLLAVFGIGVLAMALMAWRNPVLLKMAIRNVPRRPTQTALILLGLMLASLLFAAALSTGDTLTNSIRTMAVENISLVDITVRDETRDTTGRPRYFEESHFQAIRERLIATGAVDGVAPYIIEQVPVLVPDTRQSEPRVGVLGMDGDWMAGFDLLRDRDGHILPLDSLGAVSVYVSREAAEKLDAKIGSNLNLYFGSKPTSVMVLDIYDSGAVLGGDLSIVMPLSHLQTLTNNPGRINTVLVSNIGGALDGVTRTDEVMAAIEPALEGTTLEATPLKRDVLDRADETGNIFSTVFLLFGQFSIAAGVLLIFLIFVMLAAERKRELGIARAVGTQRQHVVFLFAFEGGVYSLIASAVGAFLGILVGWGMVRIMAVAFGQTDFRLVHTFNFSSVVLAYTLGVVLTFIVVLFSAWRVSRINIVRAIRDIPEPKVTRRTWRSLALAIGLPILGLLLAMGGVQSEQAGTFLLGTSLIFIGIPLLARRLGWLRDRSAYTIASILVLVWWLVPASWFEKVLPFLPEFKQGIELFFLSGIMLVTAGVWLVVYNADLLLKAVVLLLGRLKGLPPILKTAISYPMEHRFRTGMALAMFSLVIFTLIVMAIILNASAGMLSDPEKLAGGFNVRGNASYANPILDIRKSLENADGVSPGDFEAIGTTTAIPIKIKQAETEQKQADFYIAGVDAGYVERIGYDMALIADGYDSAKAVWYAFQSEPNVAVVSAALVPSKYNYDFGPAPSFALEGFFLEDTLPEVYLEVVSPFSGKTQRLKVIGVMEIGAFYASGVLTSQATLTALAGQPLPPRSFWFDVKPGVDTGRVAKALESRFLENGLQVEVIADEIKEGAKTQLMFNNLLQGFMGLGLVVGIAALGVIAARAVVERRQEIGMVRAIGFQKGMVQASFLLESSFVALLGIGIGVALGLGLSVQIVDTMSSFVPGIGHQIPWLNIVAVIVIAYTASFLTTIIPSLQAARVYPAEVLRYE
jgi:putative ABC transport system permease protein